jgi:hypothetical protein
MTKKTKRPIKIDILTVDGELKTKTVKSFTEMQTIVGGYITTFHVNGVEYLANEDGYNMNLRPNPAFTGTGHYIVGNVIRPLENIDLLPYE